MKSYIYLASPYSHPDLHVRVDRYVQAKLACVRAHKLHVPIFSPIVHWHPIAVATEDFPTDFESFKVQNDALLGAAGAMLVLGIKGWEESSGVRYEMDFAKDSSIPVVVYHHGSSDLFVERLHKAREAAARRFIP